MSKFLVSLAGLAVLAAMPALAADMPVKYKAPIVPVWSWTGCYIGGNVGAGWRRTEHTAVTPPAVGLPAGDSITITEGWGDAQVVGGGQAGCSYQWSSWLIGVELGATAARFGETVTTAQFGTAGLRDFRSDANGIYDAAARLGWANDRWLAYVKGGYAFTTLDLRRNETLAPFLLTAQASSIHANGFVAGAGVEYALTNHLVAGLEYDYYGFRPSDQLNVNTPAFLPSNYTNIKHDVQAVTARLSFFWSDLAGPVVAKY